MAGRFTVEGVFKLRGGMSRGIAKLATRMDRFTRSSTRGLKKVDRAFGSIRKGIARTGTVVGVAGVAIGGILARIIDTGSEFDKTLVAAAAKFPGMVKKGTKEFAALEEAALRIGETTEFKASAAAGAIKFMAMASVDAEQTIAALPGLVDFATAAELDLARAVDIATDSMGAFGLATKEPVQFAKNMARVTDVLATTANRANTDVEGLFEAMVKGGPVVTGAGESIETFAAIAGTLANAGIKAGEGGTAIRNAYLELLNPATAARKALKKMGAEVKITADGNFDMLGTIDSISKATKDMTNVQKAQALGLIFGKRTIAPFMVAMKDGKDVIGDFRESLEKAGGSTERIADVMRKQARGEMQGFGSAVESVTLRLWKAVRGPFSQITVKTTDWLRANKDLIGSRFQEFVDDLITNLPEIVQGLKNIGIGLAIFYGLSAAVKAAQLALAIYTGVTHAATAAKWLYGKSVNAAKLSMTLFTGATRAAAVAQVMLGVASRDSSTALGGMRGALNASKLGGMINGVTGKLGKLGLLGAALGVGFAFGSWLDHKFKVGDMLAGWLSQLTGLDKEMNKFGERSSEGKFNLGSGRPPGINLDDISSRPESAPADGPMSEPQLISPAERAAATTSREIRESISTEVNRSTLDISGAPEGSQLSTPRGSGISLQPSGAF